MPNIIKSAESVARRGAANGYASLDANSKVPTTQIPTQPGHVDVTDYNAVGDCSLTGTTITTTGTNTGTVGTMPSALKVGHTVVIDTLGAFVVAGLSGTTITFTTTVPAASTKRFMFGTDNTTALNSAFADAFANKKQLDWGTGKYLITNTIGRPDSAGTTVAGGLQVNCGGAVSNSMRLFQHPNEGGTTLVWGGAAGGTMMYFNRAQYLHFTGGLALVGQFSDDPSGVFTAYGPRAGIGFHLAQDLTPWVGTGYAMFDDLVVQDLGIGLQFGDDVNDNNADTTRVNRFLVYRCDQAMRVVHAQGLGYSFGFIHTLACPRGIVFENGGYLDVQTWNISNCDGSVGDTYQLEAKGQHWGYTYNIGSMRIEAASKRIIYIDTEASEVTVGNFIEAQNNVDTKLFDVRNGILKMQVCKLQSFSTALAAGTRPFLINAASNHTGRLDIDNLVVTGPTSGVPEYNRLFEFSPNAINDSTVRAVRDHTTRVYDPIETKLIRGPVRVYGTTTTTTAVVLTQMGSTTANTYGFSARVPKGYSIIDIYIIGERSNGAYSIFRRQMEVWRTTGNSTVVGTTTIGTDSAQGTDAPTITVDNTTHVIRISMAGTTAITTNWTAMLTLRGGTNASDF